MTSHALGKLKLKTQDETRYGAQVHAGYLRKRSKGNSWNNRYGVLWEDMGLRFYESEDRGNVVGKIKMKKINEIKRIGLEQSQELDSNCPYFFAITSTALKKTWQFGCTDSEQLSEWVHILQSALTITESNEKKQREKDSEKEAQARDSNKYIGHIGHNMSNMEDFSVAHSQSSRASSIQSLSALQIMVKEEEDIKRRESYLMGAIDEDEEEQSNEDDFIEMEVINGSQNTLGIRNIEETLSAENKNIIFEGSLERKTSQKVLGKHLWETRYFRLSTHSINVYINDKTDISESQIMLSSIISVLNVKNDGTDLKNNRFDINLRDKIINLRCENHMSCQKWIHYLSQSKKKHRKSIRTNLKSLESFQKRAQIKQFRRKTKETISEETNEEETDEFDTNYKPPSYNGSDAQTQNKSNSHGRNLSMNSWVKGIEKVHTQKQSDEYEKQMKDNDSDSAEMEMQTFEGFLIRKIGYNNDKIGEKIYFRLSDDTLEFSRIDQNVSSQKEIHKLHNSNIMGTLAVEHIKTVKMSENGNANEFVIAFNQGHNDTQWILKTEKNDSFDNANKWVNILERAMREAKDIAHTINEDGQSGRRKGKKKLGGSIKALQKMINDETIEELAKESNNSANLDVTKDMIDLQNRNKITNSKKCLCFG